MKTPPFLLMEEPLLGLSKFKTRSLCKVLIYETGVADLLQGAEISPATKIDIENAFSPDELQPTDEYALTVDEESARVQYSAEAYLTRMGCGAQVNPILLRQFSVSIARSRQSDRCISEYGEIMADVSLGYIAQANSLWGQIAGAAKQEGASKNENDARDAACSDKQADPICK